MINIEIFKLFGRILVDNDEANKSISKSDSLAQKLGGTLGKGIKTAAKFGAALGVGAAAAGTAMYKMADRAAEAADEIDKGAKSAGISAEAYQEMRYWADQNGLSQEDMEKAIGRLNQRMGMALDGNQKYAGALEKLGVSMEDVKNGTVSTEDAFATSIQTLSEMENEHERAALATEMFGVKMAREMLPALADGSLSMDEAREKANELGLVMSGDAVSAGVKFKDTMATLKDSMGMVFTQVGVNLIPIIEKFSTWIMDHMPEIQAVVQGVFSAMGMYVGYFSDAISFVAPYIQDMWEKAQEYFTLFMEKVNQVKEAIVTWVDENQDTIEHYKQLLQDMWEKAQEIFGAVKEFIGAALETIMELWGKHGERIKEIVKTVFGIIETVIKTAMDVIKEIVDVATSLFQGDWDEFWESIKDIFKNIWGAMKDIVPALIDGLVDAIKLGFTLLKDAGKHIFEGLWEGLKSVWSNISGWVTDKVNWLIDKVRFWEDESDRMDRDDVRTPDSPFDGSHANGLEYVPYDGYVAELHKGERVLTAEENSNQVNNQNRTNNTVNLKIGTLIADDNGLKQLERKLRDIRIGENQRLGVSTS